MALRGSASGQVVGAADPCGGSTAVRLPLAPTSAAQWPGVAQCPTAQLPSHAWPVGMHSAPIHSTLSPPLCLHPPVPAPGANAVKRTFVIFTRGRQPPGIIILFGFLCVFGRSIPFAHRSFCPPPTRTAARLCTGEEAPPRPAPSRASRLIARTCGSGESWHPTVCVSAQPHHFPQLTTVPVRPSSSLAPSQPPSTAPTSPLRSVVCVFGCDCTHRSRQFPEC